MVLYRLFITDITDYGNQRCIAGWDVGRGKMIRPEPAPGSFWPVGAVGPHAQFELGALVEFDACVPKTPTGYPHQTEDRVVTGASRRLRILTTSERRQILDETLSANLDDLYEGNLQVENRRGFVPLGVNCRSLGAVEVAAAEVRIFEDTDWGKKRLRCQMQHGGSMIMPTVTSTLIRQRYRDEGIMAVLRQLAPARTLHLRVGLARAFPQKPDRCYIQVNDIFPI